MTILYNSTRGEYKNKTFKEVLFTGLSGDNGLYVPQKLPKITLSILNSWKNLSYEELAIEIFKLFISEEEIPLIDLSELVYNSYKKFKKKEITPLVKLNKHLYILELYHGPTYAFKDIALQFVGNLLEYYLSKTNKKINVITATSGDTGSAAIDALKGKKNIELFVFYPFNKISENQRKQMSTVLEKNIHTVAITGDFDDCQHIVKCLFLNKNLNNKYNFTSVNSINWCRILCQIVYYFYSYLTLLKDNEINLNNYINFSVPTGNFGNILAGYYAKKMGLPIDQLIIGVNEKNNILHTFFEFGIYSKQQIIPTITPSIDISVSSNLERFVYHILQNNIVLLNKYMDDFLQINKFIINSKELKLAQNEIVSYSISNIDIENIIKLYYKLNYIIESHTAVAIIAANNNQIIQNQYNNKNKTIVFSTAHICKFPYLLSDKKVSNQLNYLSKKREKYVVLDNNLNTIIKYINYINKNYLNNI